MTTTTSNTKYKDPDAILYYKFDWKALTNGSGNSDWLASGETIASYTITEDSGIVVESSVRADTNTSVVVRLSGGTVPTIYKIVCHIVTSDGNEDDRTMYIKMVER
jgi:hypothetical protein